MKLADLQKELQTVNNAQEEKGQVDENFDEQSAREQSEKHEKKKTELTKEIARLTQKTNRYKLHLQQFEKCRDYVNGIIDQLKADECLIYRDFVNLHNVRGKKINNLVFVLIERHNGVIMRSKISNFCSDPESQSCDRDFVADVFEFHLAPKGEHGSGLFERFTKIYVSGDHGPHFASIDTIYNESRMKRRFDKDFHIVSLCSYHCYNACDAAGAADLFPLGKILRNRFAFLLMLFHWIKFQFLFI
jgi:hypothetical protein